VPATTNRRVLLRSRPVGEPKPTDFEIAEAPFNRLTVRGFIVSDHVNRLPAFLSECAAWVREGRLKYREDIVEGLDSAPRAFIGLLRGENLGKLIVKVGPDPTR
jgi:NADPH-dependent curcumin reductase CurA